MKKIVINSKLKENEILKKLQDITEFFISKGKLSKGDELVIGVNDKEDGTFLVELDASLMSPNDYRNAKNNFLQLGKVISNDLKNFDDEEDKDKSSEGAPSNEETTKEVKQDAVDSNAVNPAIQVHDSQELLLNKEENMFDGLKSLLFSDDELKDKAPETPKVDDPKIHEDLKPEEGAEKPEEPKKDKTPENPENKPAETHDNTEPKPAGDPNETPADKAEDVAEAEKKNPATPKTFDDLYFSNDELDPMSTLYFSDEELNPMSSLYFSDDELNPMGTLYFSEDEIKKSDFENAEPKGGENEEPNKKVEDLKKEASKDTDPAKDPELHDVTPADPKREPAPTPAPKPVAEPAKKSLEEVLKDYEATKKPYTKEAVASECGCTVEEVAKKMKEMKLMDEGGVLKADPATNPEVKKDEAPKAEDAIDKVEALKNLAKLNKEAKAGRVLNFVEKHFCNTVSKMFSEEEIADAEKNAAEANVGNVKESKMDMLRRLNKEHGRTNLAQHCKEMLKK